jgi:hypothetical protein
MTPGCHHKLGGRSITNCNYNYGIKHCNFLKIDIQMCVRILGKIISIQQFLTTYLMKHKMYSSISINNKPQQEQYYDTKSYLIGIDNHASAPKIGAVRRVIQDDKGRSDRFSIPGTYLVSELPIRRFSPQHAAREIYKKDN